MPTKIAFLMDPIENIIVNHDSTFAMMLAAQRRSWELIYILPENLFWQDGRVQAKVKSIKVYDDENHWFDYLGEAVINLSDCDIIMMRKDPPFDLNYIYLTYFLEHAEREGSLVVNKPQSLRDANEKFFATQFSQCMPPTIVSANLDFLKAFHAEQQKVIFKPLDGMGGRGIFLADVGEDVDEKILALTKGNTPIMAQRYLPEIKQGDKRILMINGEPVPYALARIPQQNSILGNLAAGGHGEGIELSERDRWICQQVGPRLKAMGLIFVGLDVIGDYLTEINVTSPTCIREIDRIFNLNVTGNLLDVLDGL